MVICERTVTNLLDWYDELLAVRLTDSSRLGRILWPNSALGRPAAVSCDSQFPLAGPQHTIGSGCSAAMTNNPKDRCAATFTSPRTRM